MWCWAEEKTNKEREGNDWHRHGGLDVALSAHRGVEASNVPGDLVATARESMASLVACATLASSGFPWRLFRRIMQVTQLVLPEAWMVGDPAERLYQPLLCCGYLLGILVFCRDRRLLGSFWRPRWHPESFQAETDFVVETQRSTV